MTFGTAPYKRTLCVCCSSNSNPIFNCDLSHICYNKTDQSVCFYSTPYPGDLLTLQSRAETTHARLLQVALDLFSRNGYDATGVAEICSAAGVSKGAFYHHFPSKQAVFIALLESWLTALDRDIHAVFLPGEPVAAGLMRMAGILHQVFETASPHLPMALEFWSQARRDPTIWQATIAPYRRYQQTFAGIIARGVEDGSLKPVDPTLAAQLIIGTAVGLLLEGLMDPHATDWGDAAVNSVQLLLEGLSTRSN